MKANRKSILRDEDAVSPVIAVILMVAITVVLAATVFVLVSDIGSNTGEAPANLAFDHSETDDQLSVQSSSQNANWNRLQIRADGGTSSGTIKFGLNSAATLTAGTNLTNATWTDVTSSSDPADVSDYLDFCANGGTASNFKISVQDKEAKTLLREITFTSIAACA